MLRRWGMAVPLRIVIPLLSAGRGMARKDGLLFCLPPLAKRKVPNVGGNCAGAFSDYIFNIYVPLIDLGFMTTFILLRVL